MKKYLSAILCIALILTTSVFAGPVFAEGESSVEERNELEFDPAPVVKVGNTYREAVEGDTNVRYRMLRTFAVTVTASFRVLKY